MESSRIIVPVDFTSASDQAINQAVFIAGKTAGTILLFHVLANESSQKSKVALSLAEDRLEEVQNKIRKEGTHCTYSIATGSIFDEIPAFANNTAHSIVVIGTHGIQGLKQKLLGADILKIARKITTPCLIIQENCIQRNFNPIVLPVGGHEGFTELIGATVRMAGLFKSEVHIYSITRKGDQDYERIREKTLLAEKIFSEKAIPFKRIKEESNVISVGYAKQTLQYANMVDAGLIAVMSVKSEEHYYFAQADKETMINNAYNIPVLCASGLIKY
ncbi:MAG: universal stress protein [Bacteroidota bacterium]